MAVARVPFTVGELCVLVQQALSPKYSNLAQIWSVLGQLGGLVVCTPEPPVCDNLRDPEVLAELEQLAHQTKVDVFHKSVSDWLVGATGGALVEIAVPSDNGSGSVPQTCGNPSCDMRSEIKYQAPFIGKERSVVGSVCKDCAINGARWVGYGSLLAS